LEDAIEEEINGSWLNKEVRTVNIILVKDEDNKVVKWYYNHFFKAVYFLI